MKIRMIQPGDLEPTLKIYNHYVKTSAMTFEYDALRIEEWKERVDLITENYPFLVAEEDGKILGYAYANYLKNRKAYDWSVETSIYLDSTNIQKGVGKALYKNLLSCLKKQNVTRVYACITWSDIEDRQYKKNSIYFHEHMQFQKVAHFHQCGYKFSRWYDVVWMEKQIGLACQDPKPFFPYPLVSDASDFVYNISV